MLRECWWVGLRHVRRDAEYLKGVSTQREPATAVHGASAVRPGLAVHAALAELPAGRWLLAVSGGRDSMVLLHAMARARGPEIAAVANFDHGTGTHARRAAALVEREAERLGLASVAGAAEPGLPFNEGAWRSARHAFLDAWAAELDATVVTAHTRDDQIETVVQRLLRDAGPRGLAGMRTPLRAADRTDGSRIAPRRRPLLAVRRAEVAAYADSHRVEFLDDPSNDSLAFQRNRVRHEILPALERVVPGFGDWCWALGERAAHWRESMEQVVDALGVRHADAATLVLPAAALGRCGAAEWRVLWPALAARVGVVMDRRGIERASAWAPRAKAGQSIPLSGDARIARTAATFVVKGTPAPLPDYILSQ